MWKKARQPIRLQEEHDSEEHVLLLSSGEESDRDEEPHAREGRALEGYEREGETSRVSGDDAGAEGNDGERGNDQGEGQVATQAGASGGASTSNDAADSDASVECKGTRQQCDVCGTNTGGSEGCDIGRRETRASTMAQRQAAERREGTQKAGGGTRRREAERGESGAGREANRGRQRRRGHGWGPGGTRGPRTERREGTGKMMERSRWHEVASQGGGRVMMYDGGAGLEPWVEVRASGVPGAGNGVFALRDFSEGETVAVYMGAVVRAGEKEGYMERAYAKAKEYDESKGERGTQAAHEYVMQWGRYGSTV